MKDEEIQRIEDKLREILEESLKKGIEQTQQTIQTTVNGKLDKLNAKFDVHAEKHEEDMKAIHAHMDEVRPYLDGAKGIKLIGEAWKWVLSLGVSWAVIKYFFNPFK